METNKAIEKVNVILNQIIDEHVAKFKKSKEFKVTPNYGYKKFYLDKIDGSYDNSIYSLIHYIMYQEGIYSNFLNADQLKELEMVIKEYPTSIYGPNEEEDENYEEIQYDFLDKVYSEGITCVAKRLLNEGFDVKDCYEDYLYDNEEE
ncbi:hypothetical protein GCM10022389_19830 [Flavobacterium cheonanense]|uniref:DUF4375 domain-containing protein n=1 Tax=Flavobacterium cheonanense TaxID=706183 RepID=A0ABP7VUK2_9FLAO